MEQHSIPRQVTTFEFKLIGFMTLHQFLYLVISFPFAYVIWFLFPIPFLNVILAGIIAGLGVAFAFLKLQDRALDEWLQFLVKRLNSPTQYSYSKSEEPLYFLNNVFYLSNPHLAVVHAQAQANLNSYLSNRIAVPQASARPEVMRTPETRPPEYIPLVQPQDQTKKDPKPNLSQITITQPAQTPSIQVVQPISQATANIPVPAAVQNMSMPVQAQPIPGAKQAFFSGTVYNGKQIPLAGILIYVKDTQGKVVRLLKSNPHGVFATFSPLTNGNYTLETKDPTGVYFFDTMEVLVAEVNPHPFQIMSKELL